MIWRMQSDSVCKGGVQKPENFSKSVRQTGKSYNTMETDRKELSNGI